MNKRSTLAALSAAIAIAGAQGCANAGSLSGPYIDPDQFTKVPFGSQSHWAQPWRAYGATVPASTFVNGTGCVFNVIYEDPDMLAKMLASHGIHHTRVEIGWGLMSYDDESKIIPAQEKKVLANLAAFKKYGMRPLILLNAHQAGPCPYVLTDRVLAADAHTGDLTVQLKDASGLKVGYSGFSNIVGYVLAEQLITKIDGNTVTIAKPIPKDLPAGSTVKVATMKYRPFSKPGTDEYNETIAGWQRYVENVTKIVADALGTTGAKDKGFDLEVWNELTFGGKFLSINNYYPDKPAKYQDYYERSIYTNLVKATADVADEHASEFSGMEIGDGFANTMPWSASSLEPARVAAIDKHPYPPRREYPKNNPPGKNLNAKYELDPYVPTYKALFPEYLATSIQTENMVRDMGPLTSMVGRDAHGKLSRTVNGNVKPTTMWITEVNLSAGLDNPSIDNDLALAIKAKTTLRFYSFFLNKGVSKVDIYAALSNSRKLGDKELGIIQANFGELAMKKGAEYPADDSAYTSPALAATSRMVAKMSNEIDTDLTKTHPISLTSISDTHDHAQFKGDGTPQHPDLYDRDVFAFLPYQVNSHRFVIPYYVMTRDVMQPLDPEKFTLTLDGFSGNKAKITVYDPITDKVVPYTMESASGSGAKITVTAADYPYLLIIDDPTLK